MIEKYNKLEISLRYWLLGMSQSKPEYLAAIHAYDFAREYHTGKRKDGVTPEFFHQLCIGQYLRTLHTSLMHPSQCLAVAALHDVSEDYFVPNSQLQTRFGALIATAAELLNKLLPDGSKKDIEQYFENISRCPIASIVKGADRIHNLQTMVGVFSAKKQREYLDETKNYFLPMIKRARRAFPEQEPAYENIKLMLNSQIQLLEAALSEAV